MTEAQQNTLMIKGLIASLPADQQEACNELADFIRRNISNAGEPVGTLAMALVGSEAQEKAEHP
jgi:hypothetical protein